MKKLLLSMLALSMVFTCNIGSVKANDALVIANASFEDEINADDIQLYKAERTSEKAFDGTYSIKIGMEKPEDKEEVPKWQYNLGKGGMNVVVHDAEPNTSYTVTFQVWNETGVRFQSGLIDIDGKSDTPWNIGMASSENSSKSTQWKKVTHTITTGPRTNEFYIFAYCMNQKTGRDSGAFYVDDIQISKGATITPEVSSSIAYNATDRQAFPATIPAVQSFEKAEEAYFSLNPSYQVISTDEFSKEKAVYLGDSLMEKGIINYYELKVIEDVKDGEGIVVVKQPIHFTLPESDVVYSEEDAYQIDITKDKAIVYANYIEGIQNGTMTLLQAFTQKSQLPAGTVKDYTDQRIRGFQIDTARTYFSVEWLKEQMEQMAYYKQNKLQLRLKDSEGIRWESEIVPELMDKEGYIYTKEDAEELVAFAKKFNIEIIPEVDYPGHSEMEVDMLENAGKKDWLIGQRYDSAGIVPVLNITNEEVREYITSVIKEAAEFFDAKTIHIGGDEYFDITTGTDNDLKNWANEVLNIKNAKKEDAMILYFNDVAGAMLEDGYKVLMWNDNVKLGGNAELDKRITLDFWAGAFRGRCLKGSEGANAGYNVMSSSSTNYHNLWYQERKESVRNPFPKDMYEKFTRFNYSVSSNTYDDDEILTSNRDKSLGQMFPIWSDILGGVSETVLERTVFPRYATFSYVVWGAQCDEKPMNYAEFERLMFDLGAPRNDIKKHAKLNYNQIDLQIVIDEIEAAMQDMKAEDADVQANIDALRAKLADVKEHAEQYAVDNFYTDMITELIHDFENIEFVAVAEEHQNDKTSLKEALEDAKMINLELFTKETVAVFNEAVKDVQKMIANPRATKEEITAIAALLENAINNLEYKKADYKAVEEAIAAAHKLLPENYLDFSGVDKAIAAVDYTLNILEQDKVDAMAKAINDAINELVPAFELGDKTALQELLSEAKKIKSSNCTSASYAELDKAMKGAEAVLENPVARQEELDIAKQQLQTAMDQIEYKAADYSSLNKALAYLEWRIPEDFYDYSVIEELLESIDYHLDIRYQKTIDDLADALNDAIDDEYAFWGKEWLKEALDYVYDFFRYDFDETLYTKKSIQKLYDTVDAAEAILKQVDADPDEVESLEWDLYDNVDYLDYIADYREVEKAVAKAEGLNPDNYTNFDIVQAAIDSVDWDCSEDDQNIVNEMADAIYDAMEALEEIVVSPVDKEALKTLIAKAEAYIEETYTASTWADVKTALMDAKAVCDDENATAEAVERAEAALNERIADLVKRADVWMIEQLSSDVTKFEAMKGEFTAEEFAEMAEALANANALLDKGDEEISQQEATAADLAIITAAVKLNKQSDTNTLLANLQLVVDIANATLNNDEITTARPGKVDALRKAVAVGQGLLDANASDQAVIKNAITSIEKATMELWGIVDKDALQALIDEATEITGDFTEASKNELTEAIAQAEAALDKDATVKEVSDAYARLANAIANLQSEVLVNKDALANQIKIAKDVMNNIDNYIASTIKGLKELLEEAESVFADEYATQASVDEITAALTEANMKARTKADKEALNTVIDEANAIDYSLYTTETTAALRHAVHKAEIILANEMATQEEVNAAVKEVKNALGNLQKAADAIPDDGNKDHQGDSDVDTGTTPDNGSAGNGGAESTTPNKGASTGDTTNTGALLGLLAMSGCAALALARKKKEEA